MITPDDLVRREMIYCVSSLMYELRDVVQHLDAETQEQYYELGYAPADYEEAASQEGWQRYYLADGEEDTAIFVNEDGRVDRVCESWEMLCLDNGIEVEGREVFEFWLVTGWLGDMLEAKGERVVRDFLGLETVWGRTTTGQMISCDGVIEEIARELNAS
jgi:hypothetical protein